MDLGLARFTPESVHFNEDIIWTEYPYLLCTVIFAALEHCRSDAWPVYRSSEKKKRPKIVKGL